MKEDYTLKDVKGWEGLYMVSDDGRVFSKLSNRFLSTGPGHKDKYVRISLLRDGVELPYRIHRLVAIAFIPNPDNLPEVNHKNGIKNDNRACNLEWCTRSENQTHAITTLGVANATLMLNIETGIYYHSMSEAARSIGVNSSAMHRGIKRGAKRYKIFLPC